MNKSFLQFIRYLMDELGRGKFKTQMWESFVPVGKIGWKKLEKWKNVVSAGLLVRNENTADVRNNKDRYGLYLMYDTLKNNLKCDGKDF